ncbi:MAG: hypothetical protein MUP04_02430 [Anaerolineae bacterium]|nr:hypothetical protein [Anaerolineae bacterium]
MTKTIPLLLGFIILSLLSLATREFKVKLDLRRLTLLVAVSLLLGYLLFYTAAWRFLFSTVKLLSCVSGVGIIALVLGVFLAIKAAEERRE